MPDHKEDFDLSLPEEGSLGEAIDAFKSILDIFPEDMGARESIFAACVQAERKEEALDYGIKLAELLSEQGDWKKTRRVTQKLLDLGVTDERIEVLHQTAVDSTGPEETFPADRQHLGDETEEAAPSPATLKRDLSGELDLAWTLLQNEVITEEHYETAISSLTESHSSSNSQASICLLHELASIDRVHMDKVLGFLSADTDMPYIDIERFEVDQELADLVSLEDAGRYGVLPFGQIKDELMVVVLNPLDQNLRHQIRRYFHRPVHFFLCSPEALQKVLDDLAARKKSS